MGGCEHAAGVARVGHPGWLDEYRVDFSVGDGAVLDATRDDEELTRPKRHVAIAHLDREQAEGDEEQLVSVVVRVPSELALDLDHLDPCGNRRLERGRGGNPAREGRTQMSGDEVAEIHFTMAVASALGAFDAAQLTVYYSR
jgi:hypothetical protein